MSYILYIFILVGNAILAYKRYRCKFFVYLTIIYTVILAGANLGTSDTINYINYYEKIQNKLPIKETSEIGYIIIMKFFANLNINFIVFRIIIYSICMIILYKFIKKYTNNYHMVYFLYMLHTMFMDIEQFRNFIAITIFYCALIYLIENKSKAKYIILILLATTIHTSFLFYLPLIFINSINLNNKNKKVKFLVICSIILCILTYLNGNEIPFIRNILENIVGTDKTEIYLNSNTKLGFIIPFSLHIASFIIIKYCRDIVKKNIINNELLIKKQIKIIELTYWINLLSFIYFPLYMKTVTFYRLSRNLNLLNIIVISIIYKLKFKNKYLKYKFTLMIFIWIFMWFSYDLLIRINEVYIPTFNGNFIYNFYNFFNK